MRNEVEATSRKRTRKRKLLFLLAGHPRRKTPGMWFLPHQPRLTFRHRRTLRLRSPAWQARPPYPPQHPLPHQANNQQLTSQPSPRLKARRHLKRIHQKLSRNLRRNKQPNRDGRRPEHRRILRKKCGRNSRRHSRKQAQLPRRQLRLLRPTRLPHFRRRPKTRSRKPIPNRNRSRSATSHNRLRNPKMDCQFPLRKASFPITHRNGKSLLRQLATPPGLWSKWIKLMCRGIRNFA